jgi:hypothetical protein
MVRFLATAFACILLGAFEGGVASAAGKPCREAAGKFTKCPPPASQPKHCHDSKGKFTKCSSATAKPK